MKWVSAISDLDESALATDEIVAKLKDRLAGDEPDLLLLFSSPDHGKSWEALPEQLLERLGGRALIGCSGGGIIGDSREIEQRPALSVCAAKLPDVELTTLHLDSAHLPADPAGWRERLGFGPEDDPSFVLLPDPFGFDADECLEGLDRAYPGAPIIGGLASGGILPRTNAIFVDAACYRAGAALLAMRGNVAVDPIIAQGCRPVGRTMLVSSCDGHVILGLDDASPGDALKDLHDALDEDDRELMRDSLFMGVEMKDQREYQAGDFLVRNIVGLQPDGRALAVATLLERWQAVQFHLRDKRASHEDLIRCLEAYRERSAEVSPVGALLFSCLGRGEQLYGEPHHDSALFTSTVGDLGLAGFFCNGEIGPVGGKTFLHGYTSAFGVIRPK